ncbi:hypothetical protein A8F94_16815 [Bacillus sp. FJAT-27225]|uniref:PucR family transcriptional regulator n=1 Tax=Bacillus sp. FJAT-27225 TaxID=1743144 RepID=UPI00080C2590|nr:helix-turn-helix domain-containing protein [Bacillus sp. FJAT-27225]OCA84365.1 hypothetical protein A8F94_16815 [Bacillus sp. FJAT-27225]
MFANLLELYPGSTITDFPPGNVGGSVHIFNNPLTGEWISIPADVISGRELDLLGRLYGKTEPITEKSPLLQLWRNFLLSGGELPSTHENEFVRLLQIQFYGQGNEREELETAVKGFFPNDVLILWENQREAIIIQVGDTLLEERDIASMAAAFESDFYIKTLLYIGKKLRINADLPGHFGKERTLFSFAKKSMPREEYYTFEKIFPAYIASQLPEQLAEALLNEFQEAFSNDEEMFITVKGFLENGSNASLTAKKLFIHRNTLQYRIDKFTDRTGVGLKDFHSAFTVYLACLLYDKNRNSTTE